MVLANLRQSEKTPFVKHEYTVLGQVLGLLDFVVGASIGYNNNGLSKVWAFTVQNYLTGLSSVYILRKSRSAKHKKPTLSRAGGGKGCANQAV